MCGYYTYLRTLIYILPIRAYKEKRACNSDSADFQLLYLYWHSSDFFLTASCYMYMCLFCFLVLFLIIMCLFLVHDDVDIWQMLLRGYVSCLFVLLLCAYQKYQFKC